MLIASRQLVFWRRITCSQNNIVKSVANSTGDGLIAKNHNRIRNDYGLLGLNLRATSNKDIGNIFAAQLQRVVVARQEEADGRV